MGRRIALGLIILFGVAACSADTAPNPAPAESGDAQVPPTPTADAAPPAEGDAGRPSQGDAAQPSEGDAAAPPQPEGAPIFITTMTHLEGAWSYDGAMGERRFGGDVAKIRLAMETFGAYDAKLTIESEIPFATAELQFETGIFGELLAAGHGVGTHCDITPNAPRVEPAVYAEEFRQRKTPMDMLIGAENNLGCSGGQGRSDWILGAHLAGFKFLDGTVAFGFLSMDEEDRPEGWTDDYILRQGHFHDNIPLDLAARIHPYMMADATDMTPDPEDGVVLLSSGGMGRLDAQSETAAGEACAPNCTFDDDDILRAIDAIEAALAVHDPTRVGKLDFYFPLANFQESKLPYIRDFLERVNRDYVQTGRLNWATQREIYEAYAQWNDLP